MNYFDFIEKKRHTIGDFGFEPNYIPDMAFDFQRAIIERAVRKGRIAIFADTGLRKTLIRLFKNRKLYFSFCMFSDNLVEKSKRKFDE